MRQRVLLLSGLFAALALVLLAVPPAGARLPPLTVYSTQPDGGRALRLWLEELRYAPMLLESVPFRVAKPVTTLLVLEPISWFDDDELDQLERWVRAGGTLVAAGQGLIGAAPLRHFDFELRALPGEVELASPIGPLAASGGGDLVTVRASDELAGLPAGAEAFLGDQGRVFGALLAVGAGRVVALSTPAVFSNAGLRNPANGRLVFALIGASQRGTIAFDEVHHGYGQHFERDISQLLLDRSWGQAALYAGLLTLGYLLLRGRRLGRPRPLVVTRGRSLSEYVGSLAALYHAGGKRSFAARHFERRLRREAAAQLGLPADANDDQLDDRAQALGKNVDGLLPGLWVLGNGPPPSESELVRLVGDTERAIAALRRGPTRASLTGQSVKD